VPPTIRARSAVLCLTLVLVTVAGARGDGAAGARKSSVSSTTHVNVTTARPFGEVTAAIEKQLGKYDGERIAAAFKTDTDRSRLEAMIHGMEGTSGFMLFAIRDHGQLLSLAGKQGFARQ
jgi:hypothetical protein